MDDIVDRLRACETRPLVTLEEESAGSKRDAAAWVELWKTLQDARKEIESLRLESSQTIDDLRFALQQAVDQRDLWTVKASQLQHLLDN